MDEKRKEENAQKSLREYAFLSQVADMYYNQNLLQAEIAEKLFFSRAKVSRLLTQARALGLVEIKVKQVLDRVKSVEDQLLRSFPSLTDAVVITSFGGETETGALEAVTDFASLYVSERLRGSCVLGVSNGNAVNQVTRKIHRLHDCTPDVVQIIGSGSNAHQAVESRDLVGRISEVFPGGRSFFLNTPIYLEDAYARAQLLKDNTVQTVFTRMRDCDILLTGIGPFDAAGESNPGILREYQTASHVAELMQGGAAGSICAIYYNIDGKRIPCEWNEKRIGMPFDEIRRNPMTIAVACGNRKVRPMVGALRGGLVNVIITNVSTATKALAFHEADLKKRAAKSGVASASR